jgi:hypothetical protein
MQHKTIKLVVGFVASCSFGIAMAEDAPKQTSVPSSEAKAPFAAKRVDLDALAKQRGGADPGTLSDMKLNGVVGSNNASNLTTGNNAISDGAFAGVNGVPLVVQNSGNNVLIQSATIINVQVK